MIRAEQGKQAEETRGPHTGLDTLEVTVAEEGQGGT